MASKDCAEEGLGWDFGLETAFQQANPTKQYYLFGTAVTAEMRARVASCISDTLEMAAPGISVGFGRIACPGEIMIIDHSFLAECTYCDCLHLSFQSFDL